MATVDQLIWTTASQVGYIESPRYSNSTKYGRWFGMDGVPWCAIFVSWCFGQVGMGNYRFSYTPFGADWFKSQRRWFWTPQRGDVVFFDFPGGSRRIEHTGIVERVLPYGIQTIEGNTGSGSAYMNTNGGAVMRRTRYSGIAGYGRPYYSGAGAPFVPPKLITGGHGGKLTGWGNAAHPKLEYKDTGKRVKHLQELLGGLNVDGEFGRQTKAKVEGVEKYCKFTVDGKVGDKVWGVLHKTVKRNSQGEFVREVQLSLGVKDDGDFGAVTEAAVKYFQTHAKLKADGVVGPWTWVKLLG